MSRLVLYMSRSLDGFIAGPADKQDNPFGTRRHRPHKWLGVVSDQRANTPSQWYVMGGWALHPAL
jgi:hypothetical protein